MGLKIWLPLTKDLRNQGVYNVNITNSGATYSSTGGKLGGCYNFGGSARILSSLPSAITSSVGSLACWFKLTSFPASNSWGVLMQLGSSAGFAKTLLGIWLQYTNQIVVCINGKNSATDQNIYQHSLQLNTWYHICATYDGTTVKLYLNGEVVMSQTAIKDTYSTSDGLYIGRTDSWGINGSMCDIRYYDYALSPQEVKRISQGLILHWPLEGPPLTSQYDSTIYEEPDGSLWTRVFHHNNPANGLLFSSSDTFETGVYKDVDRWYDFEGICGIIDKYEVMVKQKAQVSDGETKWRWVQNTNPLIATFDDVATNSNITRNTSSGYASSSAGGIYLRKNTNTNHCRLTISDTHRTDWYGAAGSWDAYNGGIPGYPEATVTTGYFDIYIRIDNVRPYGSTTCYDCSGFQNNGTYSAIPSILSKNPTLYKSTTSFGVNNTPKLQLNTPSILTAITNGTICWWECRNTAGGYSLIFSSASGYYIAATEGSTYQIYDNSIGGSAITMYRDGIVVPTIVVDGTVTQHPNTYRIPNEWHFYAITGINLTSWTNFKVNSYSNYPVNGYLADVRLFTTSLTANEIKSLYQNSAFIDGNGNIYGAIR